MIIQNFNDFVKRYCRLYILKELERLLFLEWGFWGVLPMQRLPMIPKDLHVWIESTMLFNSSTLALGLLFKTSMLISLMPSIHSLTHTKFPHKVFKSRNHILQIYGISMSG